MSVRDDWEELAAVDPLWAVLSVRGLRGGRWRIDRFLATGEQEVQAVLAVASGLGRPRARRCVLDFGCGVGRLARPLATAFDDCVGVDLAEGMLELARELHADLPSCTFVASAEPDLLLFEDDSFDLVHSNLIQSGAERTRG